VTKTAVEELDLLVVIEKRCIVGRSMVDPGEDTDCKLASAPLESSRLKALFSLFD
jgi:hypothetical protein